VHDQTKLNSALQSSTVQFSLAAMNPALFSTVDDDN